MGVEQYANNYTTTLTNPMTAGQTTMPVGFAAPSPLSGGQFRVIVDDEIILVTASASVPWTVTRGQEGTAAASHAAGTTVTHVLTVASLFNVKHYVDARQYNIVLDGVADDSAPLQNTLNTLSDPNVAGVTIGPGIAKITTLPSIIPGCSYKRIGGAGWGATTIRQATDSVAVLSAQTDNTYSLTLEDLTLEYANQQTASGAIGLDFHLTVGSATGFYFWNVRKVQIRKAYDAVGISGTGQVPVWSSVFEQMEINDAKHRGLSFVSPSGIGMPLLTLRDIRGFNSITPTGEFIRATAAEMRIEQLDVEGWANTVLSVDGATTTRVDGLHLENHTATSDGANIILISDGRLTVRDASISMDNNVPGQTVATSIIRVAGAGSLEAAHFGHTITVTAGFVPRFIASTSSALSISYQDIRGAGATLFVPNNDATEISRVTAIVDAAGFKVRRGTTANRPAAATAGAAAMYYDTTLGKPIWSDATNWRDATGTIV